MISLGPLIFTEHQTDTPVLRFQPLSILASKSGNQEKYPSLLSAELFPAKYMTFFLWNASLQVMMLIVMHFPPKT